MLCRDLLLSLAPAVHFAVNFSAGYVVAKTFYRNSLYHLEGQTRFLKENPKITDFFFQTKGMNF